MKYAIPVNGGILSPHFGHCEQFAMFDVDEESREVTGKDLVSSPGHEPGLLPKWLAEKGVSVVIAGGMGSRAKDLFQQNNITVIIGAVENDPEKAVLSHINGALTTEDNICDH